MAMFTLGFSGLVQTETFLQSHFTAQMAGSSRIIQGLDSAAALIKDGQIIAAAAQERFDREKKSGAFPFEAIDFCLQTAGVSFSDLDSVCGNFDFGRYAIAFQEPLARQYFEECLSPRALAAHLTRRYGTPPNLVPVDHHLAHLHCALASAPFDQGLGVVMDAAGEIGSLSVFRIQAGSTQRLARYPIHQSLGVFYSLITQFLGFAFNEDEYKVMGLASFGDADRYAEFFTDAIRLHPEGRIEIPCLEMNSDFGERLFFTASMRAIEKGLGFGGAEAPVEQKADVSAALQRRFTQAVMHICAHFAERENLHDLLLSGGCAENCMTAGAMRTDGRFGRIHVGYASGDDGTALGAAAARSFAMGQPVRIPQGMPFFGPAPQLDPAMTAASRHGLRATTFASERAMLQAAAAEVAEDRIVALCNGPMEYGARALGNRSLLALPSSAANKERINLAIKKRQNYRPFAPAVTAEAAHLYFDLAAGETYPYMTMLTHVRPEHIGRLPAITHVDGTARVQTVDREHNPSFYYLLTQLGERTGVPVVLNTSYNVNHQPIVCTEEEAVTTFVEMGIDALYIAGARISRQTDP
ncbi:carbamoyltransferase family protein [Teichococcus coralli]|nr:carbamoyltransferase C-terminal domain-containing protein [Pseudoroseomonas coralli]